MTAIAPSGSASETLRQLVATLAYRAAKVLRDAPAGFAAYRVGPASRTPVQIVAHMGDLMTWGTGMIDGEYTWRAEGSDDWDTEVARFFRELGALDSQLAQRDPPGDYGKLLIQGPLADALTHTGQLAMLRGLAGAPVKPESYARAEILAGRVGLDQAPPGAEFEGDASTRKPRR